jgi:N-acetylmuramoyl-L-alanine amidase
MRDWFGHMEGMEIMDDPCPNSSPRDTTALKKIDTITLHFSKGVFVRGTARWAGDPEAGGAGHFYAGRKGQLIQRVALSKRAWHHGKSRYHGYDSRTDRGAIGIEMANCGHMTKQGKFYYFTFGDDPRRYPERKYGPPKKATLKFSNGKEFEFWWEPYKKAQIDAVLRLVTELVLTFDIPIQRIIGHEDVAFRVGRKLDPGPMWPWKQFISDLCDILGINVPDDVWRLHKTVV